MINFSRLSKYILAYLILLIISALISAGSILRPVDLAVYKGFYLNSHIEEYREEIKNEIIFIDIPREKFHKDSVIISLRHHVANLLLTIDSLVYPQMKNKPTVILDMTFGNTQDGLDSLMNAVNKLDEKGVYVYAAYEMPGEDDLITEFEFHDSQQARDLYEYYFTGGRLNVAFNNLEKSDGLVTYNNFETIASDTIESLPVRVITDYDPTRDKEINKELIQYQLPLQLPYDPESRKDNYFYFTKIKSSNSLTENSPPYLDEVKTIPDLTDKFIIIGTPEDIVKVGKYKVPGPYVLASAIVDQLKHGQLTQRVHDNIIVQLAFVIFFALFVCLIFSLIYKYVRRLQTLPHVIAIISLLAGVLLLIGAGFALLSESTVIRPALPTLSMIWAAVLAWHFTKKFLVTGIMEGGQLYDIFISYSHGDSTWVKQNILQPLNALKKPDGTNLNIFFDENSIGLGELFTTKYMRGIVDSKLFVPVMSEEYYRKNHCRNEMDLAVKRHVEKLINICIIALDFKYVPEEFTNINLVDVNQNKNFIKTIQSVVIDEDADTIQPQIDTSDNQKDDHGKENSLAKSSGEITIESAKKTKDKKSREKSKDKKKEKKKRKNGAKSKLKKKPGKAEKEKSNKNKKKEKNNAKKELSKTQKREKRKKTADSRKKKKKTKGKSQNKKKKSKK